MRKSELKELIREVVKEVIKEGPVKDKNKIKKNRWGGIRVNETTQKEYVIWGIPPNKRDEELLYTKAKSMPEAKKVCDILEKEHGVKKCRVQVLDLSKKPDFTNVFSWDK
jgi:hypothetical protein